MIKNNKTLLKRLKVGLLALMFFAFPMLAVANNGIPLRETIMPAVKTASVSPKTSYLGDSSGIQLKGGIKIDTKEQLVTLNLIDSNLRQVLRMLANKSGKNIIIDDSITAADTISLDLVNVTVNKVFEYIMTIKKLSYWQDGNTLIVASNEKSGELGLNKTEIKPIKIKYVDAQKVADFLNSNIFSLNKPETSKASIVTSNPATNEIYIFGNKSDYELAKKIVPQLDTKPQVNTFSVNYANPITLASKICMSAFQNTAASSVSSSSSSGGSTGGSQITTVCTGTASGGSSGGGSGSTLSAFSTPSYTVLADTGLSQITIYGGTVEQMNMADGIVKSFDKKEPQVYLEISIIELSEEGSKDFKNQILIHNPKNTLKLIGGNSRFEYSNKYPIAPLVEGVGTIFSNLDSYGNFNDIIGALDMVITKNKGRLLANPRILASNNTESKIDIKEDIVAGISTETVTGTATTTTRTVIQGEVGIQLAITPKISPNGYVSLSLEPTYDSVKGPDGFGGTLTRSRTFKSTNVRVKDGETLVVAGLIQENETNSHQKTPGLSDIPIIGSFFKDQSTAKGRSELIFMITPRIIKDDVS